MKGLSCLAPFSVPGRTELAARYLYADMLTEPDPGQSGVRSIMTRAPALCHPATVFGFYVLEKGERIERLMRMLSWYDGNQMFPRNHSNVPKGHPVQTGVAQPDADFGLSTV